MSRWEFSARYNMTASDAESMTLAELLSYAEPADKAAFEALWLGYTETYGAPDLRQAIADTYEGLAAEDVLCFAGAEEGIYTAMRVLLGADDHAVVVTPNYQAAETVPLSVCEVTGVPLEPDQGWTLDIDRVAAALKTNTKLVSINFPNNPTGKILEHDRFDALVDLCRARDIWLFSDEVYRGIERDPALRLPQAADAYERGLSLGVMSKAYGLPGLRIGWIACRDRALLARLERYKHFTTICNAAPSERLALIALNARQKLLARTNRLAEANLALTESFLADYAELFSWHRPEGACVGFVRYRGEEGVEDFAERLVQEAGVLLLPASVYRSDLNPVPDDHFRIGFGRKDVEQGLATMRGWLQRNRP